MTLCNKNLMTNLFSLMLNDNPHWMTKSVWHVFFYMIFWKTFRAFLRVCTESVLRLVLKSHSVYQRQEGNQNLFRLILFWFIICLLFHFYNLFLLQRKCWLHFLCSWFVVHYLYLIFLSNDLIFVYLFCSRCLSFFYFVAFIICLSSARLY